MSTHMVEIPMDTVAFALDLPACMSIKGVSVMDDQLVVEVDSTQDLEYDRVEAIYDLGDDGEVKLVGFEPL